MTLPFKPRALNAITAALKEITPDNGYLSNLADFTDGDGVTVSRVFRGRAWFGETDPVPMVSVLEGSNPADLVAEPPVNTATGEYDWSLVVQGFVNDDPVHPTDPAYPLLADVRKRLAIERRRTGINQNMKLPNILGLGVATGEKSHIVDLYVGPGVVRPADDVSAKAYFWLTLTLRIIDNAEAPYL